MVYSENGTILCGHLSSGKNVTITLINPKTDIEISTINNICVESKIRQGLYYFDTLNINDDIINNLEVDLEIVYIMEDEEGASYGGKIIISRNHMKLNEQIKIVKDTLDQVPENIMETEVYNNNTLLELLLIIKRNSDLILV